MSFLLFLSFQLQSQYIYYELFLQIIILKKSICNKYEPTNGGAISHGQRSFWSEYSAESIWTHPKVNRLSSHLRALKGSLWNIKYSIAEFNEWQWVIGKFSRNDTNGEGKNEK